MAVEFELKVAKKPRGMTAKGFQEIIFPQMVRAARLSGDVVQKVMTEVSPVGVTSKLQKSWARGRGRGLRLSSAGFGIIERVAAEGKQGLKAHVWDDGTKLHFPPASPIEAWVRGKLANISDLFVAETAGQPATVAPTERNIRRVGFAIRRNISRRGLPNPDHPEGHRQGLFTEALKNAERRILRIQRAMNRRMIAGLNRS